MCGPALVLVLEAAAESEQALVSWQTVPEFVQQQGEEEEEHGEHVADVADAAVQLLVAVILPPPCSVHHTVKAVAAGLAEAMHVGCLALQSQCHSAHDTLMVAVAWW